MEIHKLFQLATEKTWKGSPGDAKYFAVTTATTYGTKHTGSVRSFNSTQKQLNFGTKKSNKSTAKTDVLPLKSSRQSKHHTLLTKATSC